MTVQFHGTEKQSTPLFVTIPRFSCGVMRVCTPSQLHSDAASEGCLQDALVWWTYQLNLSLQLQILEWVVNCLSNQLDPGKLSTTQVRSITWESMFNSWLFLLSSYLCRSLTFTPSGQCAKTGSVTQLSVYQKHILGLGTFQRPSSSWVLC